MEKEDVKENVNGKFEHFLKAVEFLGNNNNFIFDSIFYNGYTIMDIIAFHI